MKGSAKWVMLYVKNNETVTKFICYVSNQESIFSNLRSGSVKELAKITNILLAFEKEIHSMSQVRLMGKVEFHYNSVNYWKYAYFGVNRPLMITLVVRPYVNWVSIVPRSTCYFKGLGGNICNICFNLKFVAFWLKGLTSITFTSDYCLIALAIKPVHGIHPFGSKCKPWAL